MSILPFAATSVFGAFAPLFSRRVFAHARRLLMGAILASGRRTVTAAFRVMGTSADRHFQNYHRVLNRARWSSLNASRILLGLLLGTFVPEGPVVRGLDETLERRRGDQISAKGSIAIPCVRPRPTVSTRAGCAGSACWCRHASPGATGCGRGRS